MGRQRSVTVVLAIAFALFHALVVAVPVLLMGATGEGQGYLVLFFDLPLVLLANAIPATQRLLHNDVVTYYFVVIVLGTLMWAAVGALCGWVWERSRRSTKSMPFHT